MTDLLQPLTEVEKAELSSSCKQALTQEGHLLLRRLMVSTDAEIARLQARIDALLKGVRETREMIETKGLPIVRETAARNRRREQLLRDFVGAYPCGVNPDLDAVWRRARAELGDEA